MSTSEEEDILV